MNRLQVIAQSLGESSKILIQRKEKLGIVWLNSPKDLNCLSIQMGKQLNGALQEFDDDPKVKVILIRSKHSKVFCAGADIKHMKENDYSSYPHKLHFLSLQRTFRHLRKPVIAVVEGKALGGGFELALLADVILASKNAVFALPEITLGLIPGIGGTQNLARIVGSKVAMKMILSGQSINAEQAHRLNIATLIDPDRGISATEAGKLSATDKFEAQISRFTEKLTSKHLESLVSAKKAIKLAQETTLDQGLEYEATLFQNLFKTEGAKEGLAAFVEKRKPNFSNM